MKAFAIGDVHGHRVALEALLAALPVADGDLLVFLGDYVDKGPEVCGTLDLLCALSQSRANTIFLRGNHDQMLLNARRDKEGFTFWECLAGDNPLASYGPGPSSETIRLIPEEHWRFIERSCVDHFETERFIFVHGGVRPDQEPAEEEVERLQWMALSMAEPHRSGRTVICGHTRSENGRIADLGHTICIDTGISKDGWLTALELDGFEFWQCDERGELRTGRLA